MRAQNGCAASVDGMRRLIEAPTRAGIGRADEQSRCRVGLKHLADYHPLAVDLQQMEEVSERDAGHGIGVNASAGCRADDFDSGDCGLGVRRWPEVLVDSFKENCDGATHQLALAVDAVHRRLGSKCRL